MQGSTCVSLDALSQLVEYTTRIQTAYSSIKRHQLLLTTEIDGLETDLGRLEELVNTVTQSLEALRTTLWMEPTLSQESERGTKKYTICHGMELDLNGYQLCSAVAQTEPSGNKVLTLTLREPITKDSSATTDGASQSS